MRAWTFGNVASMITCSVLRCPKTSSGVFKLVPGSNMEPPVCADHLETLESGARWMLTPGDGMPDDSGRPSLRLTLLMDADLPPELMAWDGDWSITDQPGMNVRLLVGQQEVTFWASELAAKRLSSFLAAPPS